MKNSIVILLFLFIASAPILAQKSIQGNNIYQSKVLQKKQQSKSILISPMYKNSGTLPKNDLSLKANILKNPNNSFNRKNVNRYQKNLNQSNYSSSRVRSTSGSRLLSGVASSSKNSKLSNYNKWLKGQ